MLKTEDGNPGDQIIVPLSSCSSDPAYLLCESPHRHPYSVCAAQIFGYHFFVARCETVTVGISQERGGDPQIITLKGKVALISLRFYTFIEYIVLKTGVSKLSWGSHRADLFPLGEDFSTGKMSKFIV